MKRINFFLLVVMASMMLFVSGCGKKKKKGPKLPMALRMTPEQRAWRDRLSSELDGKLKTEFNSDAVLAKSKEYFNNLLDSPDTAVKVGNLRAALKLKPDDELDEFFNFMPKKTLEEIIKENEELAKKMIRSENNLLSENEILATVRRNNPVLPDKSKIEFKTLQGKFISGMIVQRNKQLVKIGSRLVNREDAPMDIRAKIWPEENEENIQQLVRDEQSKNRFHYKKNMPIKLAKMLPEAFLREGYLPNVFKPGASLKNQDAAMWITPSQALAAAKGRIVAQKEGFIKDFWHKKGYVEETVEGVNYWVPLEEPEKEDE